MSETVQANDGAMLPLSSIPQQFMFSGGFVSTITAIYQGNTYVQTFLNDGTNIIYISGWINSNFQPLRQEVMVSQSGVIMVSQDNEIMVTQ